MTDALVIGGGIHGCSAALHLQRRGLSVVLLEKDTVGRHASGVNAGGVRQIYRALPEIPLSVAAMRLWERIGELVDDDCGFGSSGHIFVAETDDELDVLKRRRQEVVDLGYDHEELVIGEAMHELVPALSKHCVGGLISFRDGAALPYRTVQAFRRKFEALGGKILEDARVASARRVQNKWRVETLKGEAFEAPFLVVAAGAWSLDIARQAGETADMRAIAPMLMITERMPPFITQVVSAVSAPLSFKQFANGTVLIGGGYEGFADTEHNTTDLDFRKLSRNAKTVYDMFPVMRGTRIVRAWAGIEGKMSDGIPVIGSSQTEEGLIYAFGFSAHGFQLGPIVGSLIADIVTEGRPGLPIDAFSIARFAPG